MKRPECEVKNCKEEAFIRYGTSWICGNCYTKLVEKQKALRRKELEDLADDD